MTTREVLGPFLERGQAQLTAVGNEALPLTLQMSAIGKLVTRRRLWGCAGLLLVAKFDDDVRLAICADCGKLPERHTHLRKFLRLQCGSRWIRTPGARAGTASMRTQVLSKRRYAVRDADLLVELVRRGDDVIVHVDKLLCKRAQRRLPSSEGADSCSLGFDKASSALKRRWTRQPATCVAVECVRCGGFASTHRMPSSGIARSLAQPRNCPASARPPDAQPPHQRLSCKASRSAVAAASSARAEAMRACASIRRTRASLAVSSR